MDEKERSNHSLITNEKEDLIDSILDSSYDGIFILDKRGKIIYASKSLQRIVGLIPHKILGKNIDALIDKGVIVKNSVSTRVLKTKKRMTNLLKLKDEMILSTATPYLDSDREIKYVICNVRNITTLEELKCRLQGFDENSPVNLGEIYEKKLITELRRYGIKECLIKSKKMVEIVELILSLANFDLNYLITGETGSGKGLIAKLIHFTSKRKDNPFININCAAIPADLLESELFGYQQGAFTGASKDGQVGLLVLAHTGTVFLDEIGAMPMKLQSKILKFLDDKKIKRLGSSQITDVSVQTIAATNCDLRKKIEEGSFRKDLFFRLNEIAIEIPPLRQRPEDVRYMIEYFWERYQKKFEKEVVLEASALGLLETYTYPGNVRELKNILKRLLLFAKKPRVSVEEVVREIGGHPASHMGVEPHEREKRSGFKSTVISYEKEIIRKAYLENGSTYKAAETLNMNQSTFYRKAKKYGIIS